MTPSLHWLGLWEFNPLVWAVCLAALPLYLRLPGAGWNRRGLAWALGVLTVLLAMESPIEAVGERYLFSVHMAQHLLLAMVAPPLLIRGLPDPTVDRLLRARLTRPLRPIVHPVLAVSVYFVVLIVWHIPAALDLSLRSPGLYFLQHLTFLGVGLMFWWAIVVHREGEPWNLSPLGEVAYLTCGALPAVVVGLTLALLPSAIYAGYASSTAALGISALGDQHLGGLLMFGFDNTVMVGFAGYYFWRLFPDDQERERDLPPAALREALEKAKKETRQ